VSYAGKESTAPVSAKQEASDQRALRHELEALHLGGSEEAVDKAWPHLNSADRFIRHAARTALEQQPLEAWSQRALAEQDPQGALTSLLALVRKAPRSYKPTSAELDTPAPVFPAENADRHPLQGPTLAALARFNWSQLSAEQKEELLRVYTLALYRLGPPDEATRAQLIERLDAHYPAKDRELNAMLTELLCYLQADTVVDQAMPLLAAAPTQEEQIDLARSLRFVNVGWTSETRRQFFEWLNRSAGYKGGNNFATFIKEIKQEAVARVPKEELASLDAIINAPAPKEAAPLSREPRPFVKEWTMEEVAPLLETKLQSRDFERGRAMFATARCFDCHRFANEGGSVGPDLTGLAGRFSSRDLLESVLEPDKVISDQYAGVIVQTSTGKVVMGRVTNYDGDEIHINTDMLDPTALEHVNRPDIEEMRTSPVSMMPTGLLNSLNEEELLDLMAFLLSRGDRNDPMFKP
jgi:putative heme-binding domain-containing protein